MGYLSPPQPAHAHHARAGRDRVLADHAEVDLLADRRRVVVRHLELRVQLHLLGADGVQQ